MQPAVSPPILLATHTYGPDGHYVLAIGFRAGIVRGQPRPPDEVAEVRWVSAEELDATDFAWEHDRARAGGAGGGGVGQDNGAVRDLASASLGRGAREKKEPECRR